MDPDRRLYFCIVSLLWLTGYHGSFGWAPAGQLTSRRPFASAGGVSAATNFIHRWTDHSSTKLHAALPDGYQEFGEKIIRQAGRQCGISKEEDLSIEWKAGRIIVTVHGQVYVSAEDDSIHDENDIDDDLEDDPLAAIASMPVEEAADNAPSLSPGGVDVTALARAVNAALDDDGIGLAVAETHEIEVTTPGASDELQGQVMFEAYKGFDVICQQLDPKTKKTKQIEGRLVERNDEFTILNVKGRMKKMKNSTVLSIRLPKAKKEKGAK